MSRSGRRKQKRTSLFLAVGVLVALGAAAGPTAVSASAPLNPVLAGYVPTPFVSGHAASYAWGMVTMSDGNIAVGDYWNQKVELYAPDGSILNANLVNQVGFGAGDTQSPYGLAVDPINGDLYFADTDRYMVHRYSYDPLTHTATQQNWWGSQGNGTQLGRYMYPRSVAVDQNHNVYVVDTWAGNMQVVHTDTTAPACIRTAPCPAPVTLEKFGAKGSAVGLFKQAHGEAIYYGGNPTVPGAVAGDRLYVADDGNKRVAVFVYNPATGLLDMPDTADFGPTASFGCAKSTGNPACHFSGDLRGVAIDQTRGYVYVVDAAGDNVDMFDLNGNWIQELGKKAIIANQQVTPPPGYFTDGGREVTVDPATGYIWVGDMPDFRLQVFDPSQTVFANQVVMTEPDPPMPPPIGGFNGPRGVAIDPSGNLFFTDTYNQRIERLDALTGTWTSWGSRGRGDWAFNYPRMLATDPVDGTLVVADTDNHLIKKFSNDGTQLLWKVGGMGSKTSPLQFKNPHGVAIGPDQTIYIADSRNQRVVELDKNGVFIRAFGSNGNAAGMFKFPRGIVVDNNGTPGDTSDDTLWIVDSVRDLVLHFTITGTFLGEFSGPCVPKNLCAANQFSGPFDIAATGGYLFVADAGMHFVRVWTNPCYGSVAATTCTLVPTYLQSIGLGRGKQFDGHMIQPQGLDVSADGQYLYVAEQSTDRVSVWKLYGP